MRTRVKICGITRPEDAAAAVAAGADALGFVFWQGSPRAIAPADAAAISVALPALVTRAGVFVNATPEEVRQVVRVARLDVVQLHGDERVDDYMTCGAPLIRAIGLESASDVERALACPPHVTVLIDASDRVRRGGTGQRADWRLARRVSDVRPVMLAGGLTPQNVGEAIRTVRPWAIDVSSGVEASPGRKDPALIRDVFAAVAAADQEAE